MWFLSIILPPVFMLVSAVVGTLALTNKHYAVLIALAVLWVLGLLYILVASLIEQRYLRSRYQHRYAPAKFYAWRKIHQVVRRKQRFPIPLCREAFSQLHVPMQLLMTRGVLSIEYANWLLGLLLALRGNAELAFGLGPNDAVFWIRFDFCGRSWRILRSKNEFVKSRYDTWICAAEQNFDTYATLSYQDFLTLQAEFTMPKAAS